MEIPPVIFINQTDLLKRHWTRTSIRNILGEPEQTRKVWYGTGTGIENLWSLERVMQLEGEPAFRKARSALFTRRARLAAGKQSRDAVAEHFAKGLNLFSSEIDLKAVAAIYARLKEFSEQRPHNWIAGSLVFWPSYSPPDGQQTAALRKLIEAGVVTVEGGLSKGWTKRRLLDVDLTVIPNVEDMDQMSGYEEFLVKGRLPVL
jgi:hypothetical protein